MCVYYVYTPACGVVVRACAYECISLSVFLFHCILLCVYTSHCGVVMPTHHSLPGTTGEHIVLVGDSAGGNFALATAMKVLEHGTTPY